MFSIWLQSIDLKRLPHVHRTACGAGEERAELALADVEEAAADALHSIQSAHLMLEADGNLLRVQGDRLLAAERALLDFAFAVALGNEHSRIFRRGVLIGADWRVPVNP